VQSKSKQQIVSKMVSNNQKLHLDYSEHKHNTTAGGSETAGSQQQQGAPKTAGTQSKTHCK
jgi:hypothetical protein